MTEQSFEHIEILLRSKQLRYVFRSELLLLSLGRQGSPFVLHSFYRNLMSVARVGAIGTTAAGSNARGPLARISIVVVKRATHGLRASVL